MKCSGIVNEPALYRCPDGSFCACKIASTCKLQLILSGKLLVPLCMIPPFKVPQSYLGLQMLQEENTVRPKNSSAQPEEEQLHPLSKRQKLGPEQEGKATSARPLVSYFCFPLLDLSKLMPQNPV